MSSVAWKAMVQRHLSAPEFVSACSGRIWAVSLARSSDISMFSSCAFESRGIRAARTIPRVSTRRSDMAWMVGVTVDGAAGSPSRNVGSDPRRGPGEGG